VFVLLGSGIGATVLHMPILAALWQTSYGKAILVKIALLAAAMLLAAVNLLRLKPRLDAAKSQPEPGESVARAYGALSAARRCSSQPPSSPRLSSRASHRRPARSRTQARRSLTSVPAASARRVHANGNTLQVLVTPNRAVATNSFALQVTRNGVPVRGAAVTLVFEMLDMQMANHEYRLTETQPGIYTHPTPALVMVGNRGLAFTVTPVNGQPFTAYIVDRTAGCVRDAPFGSRCQGRPPSGGLPCGRLGGGQESCVSCAARGASGLTRTTFSQFGATCSSLSWNFRSFT
jgi:Copper resistance protein D/YtkA-like